MDQLRAYEYKSRRSGGDFLTEPGPQNIPLTQHQRIYDNLRQTQDPTYPALSSKYEFTLAAPTPVKKVESSSHATSERNARGNVVLGECCPDGKYITIDNVHRTKEENVGEWKLKRKVDLNREIVFNFPKDFIIRPNRSVKIWARGQGGSHFPPQELIFDSIDTWGKGKNIETFLYSQEGEEKVSHIQRSS